MELSKSDFDAADVEGAPEVAVDLYNGDPPQFGVNLGFSAFPLPWLVVHFWRWRLSFGWLY